MRATRTATVTERQVVSIPEFCSEHSTLESDFLMEIGMDGRLRLAVRDGDLRLQLAEESSRDEAEMELLRDWLRERGTGAIRRLAPSAPPPFQAAPTPWDAQNQRPDFVGTVRADALRDSLGPPHYEEYDGRRTTGEPWAFWCFEATDTRRVVVEASMKVPYTHLYFDPVVPREVERWLASLGLASFSWDVVTGDFRWLGVTTGRFRVMRQDDNGNAFVVLDVSNDHLARRWVEVFEARGHKQHYWFEQVE